MKRKKIKLKSINYRIMSSPISLLWERPIWCLKALIIIGGTFLCLHVLMMFRGELANAQPNIQTLPLTREVESFPVMKMAEVAQTGNLEIVKAKTATECINSLNRFSERYPGSKLKGYGEKIYNSVTKVAETVNPEVSENDICQSSKWLLAIACMESSCGRNPARGTKFNYWGLKDYRNGSNFEEFLSIEHAIETYTYRTYRPYLQHNTVKAYQDVYCQSACNGWEIKVSNFIEQMEE